MIKFLDKKLFRYLSVFLFLNSSIFPVKSSSALAAWALNTNWILDLRTKSNTNLKAYFQKANQISGDRFWVDFPGELKNPRTIKGKFIFWKTGEKNFHVLRFSLLLRIKLGNNRMAS